MWVGTDVSEERIASILTVMMKMTVTRSSEMLVTIYKIKWHHNTEDQRQT
jgi:hypothetical protein